LQSIQLGLSRLPNAGSETHYKILREWIRSCDRTDQCYPKHLDFLPTRLLDVSGSDSKTIRLLDIGRGNTVPRRYIALSHRWGSPEHNTKFCTYKSNIEEFKLGINVSRLPKTFQNAVNVTRGLGLEYLWIDSLCIVQDDENDWEAEAKLMGRVFSSAYCTIAASCASGSSDGFLKPRQERRTVVMQGPQGDEIFCVCEAIDDFYRDVDQGELNQRGWVLQERALSRRTIYFTETQSYWECGGGVRCETMTKMKKYVITSFLLLGTNCNTQAPASIYKNQPIVFALRLSANLSPYPKAAKHRSLATPTSPMPPRNMSKGCESSSSKTSMSATLD
jgi:hypothetical protein